MGYLALFSKSLAWSESLCIHSLYSLPPVVAFVRLHSGGGECLNLGICAVSTYYDELITSFFGANSAVYYTAVYYTCKYCTVYLKLIQLSICQTQTDGVVQYMHITVRVQYRAKGSRPFKVQCRTELD